MLRKRTTSQRPICVIDVAAFAGVLVVLVVALLLTAMMTTPSHDGVSIDLPKVRLLHFMPGASREGAIVINIMRDGKIYFGSTQVAAEELPADIHESLGRGAERRVYLRADARAYYGTVRNVLEGVRLAGVENIALLADQRHVPAP
jgi:biopolymer transport protein TolR